MSISWPSSLPAPSLSGHRKVTSARNWVTEMESGRRRVRRQFEQLRKVAEVAWTFTPDQFLSFKSFFEGELENGTQAFMLNLYGEEQEVKMLRADFALEYSDNLFRVTSLLELFPVVLVPADLTFTYTLDGAPLRDTGQRISFAYSMDGSPLPEREQT